MAAVTGGQADAGMLAGLPAFGLEAPFPSIHAAHPPGTALTTARLATSHSSTHRSGEAVTRRRPSSEKAAHRMGTLWRCSRPCRQAGRAEARAGWEGWQQEGQQYSSWHALDRA